MTHNLKSVKSETRFINITRPTTMIIDQTNYYTIRLLPEMKSALDHNPQSLTIQHLGTKLHFIVGIANNIRETA